MEEETKKKLIDLGLEELEKTSRQGVESLFKAIEIIVLDSENKIDDIVLPWLPKIKEKLLDLVDKIHKEEE